MDEPSDNRIGFLRECAGLTKADLGKLCMADASQISRLESGDTQLTLAWQRKIAKALNVKASDLLVDDDYHLRLNKEEIQLVKQFRTLNPLQRAHAASLFNMATTAFHQIASQNEDPDEQIIRPEAS